MKYEMMFTIDLLKGQDIPIKSGPEGVAIAAVTLAVPIIVAIVMFGFYLRNGIAISIQKQGIVSYEAKINELSNAVELQRSFEKEKNNIVNSLSEVKSSIGRHTQWSPILETVVRNVPDSMVLTKIEAKQKYVKRKVPKKNDPKEMIDISVPVRTLHMSISGSPQYNCDKAVRDFRDRLRFSALLEPRLEDIKVSQWVGTLDGQDVISYEIDCIFKPGL